MAIVNHLQDAILTIEIARPEKKNAFTARMYQEFADRLRQADADSRVNAVVIQGQPDIFCAGNDIEDFLADPPNTTDAPVFQFMRALSTCEKPVIAAVRGAGVGIGATMLLHCDLVFLAEETRLMMPFVSLGLVPEFASSLLLPKLVGAARAAEYLLLGTPISAQSAVDHGIANRVLPTTEVLPQARTAAERFNKLPVHAIRATKRLLRRWSFEETQRAIDAEAEVFRVRLQSSEAKSAFQAFLQKHPGKN